jgi:signal transduction histidine kinase
MTSAAKFPIRRKLMLLIMACVLGATAAYLGLAIRLFKDDKTQLVYELNAGTVKTLSAEVEAVLLKYVDKVKLLTQGHQSADWTTTVFENEPDLIAFSLYRQGEQPSQWERLSSVRNKDYLKLYGLSATEVDKLREARPIPFAKALAKGQVVFNSTVPGGAPILSLAVAMDVKGRAGAHVAVVDLKVDRFLKMMGDRGIVSVFMVDDEGKVLVHSDAALMASNSQVDNEIVRQAVDSPVGFQMKRFEWKETRWLGAYQNVKVGGLIVIGQAEEETAFLAAKKLIQKSLLFAAIIVTVSLLISGWQAGTFTQPLNKLVEATEKLKEGEFSQSIHVDTKDEIARLATAFNTMATDIQRQQTELKASKADLEIKVKERTSALEAQKTKASEAQDALLRTTRLAALGELAGATAHEVLNPLNNMNIRVEKMKKRLSQIDANNLEVMHQIVDGWKKSYAEGGWDLLQKELSKTVDGGKKLLEEDLDNLATISREEKKKLKDDQDDVDFLIKEMTRISRMVNGMRSLSRVGGERKPLDIHVPIEDTLAALSDLIEKRKITVIKEFGADAKDSYVITGDRDELVQVFSNLLRNALHAIDAAKRRSGEIRIATKLTQGRIEIRLTDNGTGIAAQHVAKVFEPTFTTKSVEEGTGLGLSISRRLIRAFGGEIEIETTTAGVGTTFLVWFPVQSAAKASG